MQRLRNRLISYLLRKDKLVAVPTSWQEEYVKLIKENQIQTDAIATIINEYNNLLKDFYGKNTVKELQDILTQENVPFKSTASKNDLVELVYKEFSMKLNR